jgi:hypothetical protein
MKKKQTVIAAVLFAIILAATLWYGAPALAQNLRKTIDIYYRDIKIYVDGDLIIPKNALGVVVEPFIHDGTTYLPVRAVSEALGKTVEWDGVTNSVYIGEFIPQEITDITVSTTEELIGALGSNRRILVKEGKYNLSAVSPSYINNPAVYFQEAYDGPELILDGVHDLTIQGVGDKQSEIIIDPRYAFVMNFQNCSNISIMNVKAGHTEGGYCEGGVFSFENSSGIRIDNALMYGCGTIGLSLLRATDVKITNSTVSDCTYGIMSVDYSSDILFKDCIFRDNKGFTMVEVGHTNGFTIDSCAFLRNIAEYSSYPMFSMPLSENVKIIGNSFEDNKADALIEQEDIVFDTSNTFKNNSFDIKQ